MNTSTTSTTSTTTTTSSTSSTTTTASLERLEAGQLVPFGGHRVTTVSSELADSFGPGDHLVVVQETGALLHVPAEQQQLVGAVVERAVDAFGELAGCSDDHITVFFDRFAALLEDDREFAVIADANAADVEQAERRGRSTTRLVLAEGMRREMVAGLRTWRDAGAVRHAAVDRIDHDGWSVETLRAPLGVVGFVFEGRPNVFADAVGVLRTGNTVVFRIGSDALGTARAIMESALRPALVEAGLPEGAVGLVDSAERSAGWALFGDRRLSLAVARGSGAAVAQLGAVARQAGVPVSLHGTGGAWMIASGAAPTGRFASSVTHSLDRKVCNTLNVCCIVADRAAELVPVFVDAVERAAAERGSSARVHADPVARGFLDPVDLERRVSVRRADGVHDEPFVSPIEHEALGVEWEWEDSPEVSLVVVPDLTAAIELCNRWSPHFVVSLISDDAGEHAVVDRSVDAPFVGDGFTRWVDGQYALSVPELGLSNWEGGRLLGRGAILSGDSVHTVRYRAHVTDPSVRR